MGNKNHIHKLKRYVYRNKEAVYFCVNDCKFKVVVGQALGKLVECWKCNRPFEMNEYSVRLAKPRCPNCVEHKHEVAPTIPATKPANVIDIKADPIDDLRSRLEGVKSHTDDLL